MFELQKKVHGSVDLFRVVDPDARREMLRVLASFVGVPELTAFPGPLPVSIERKHFPELRKRPYLVSRKTDGWRAALSLFVFRDKNMALLWDRTLEPFLVPISTVPVALWQGSVFDGEVVRNRRTGQWTFLVFDALRVSGIPVWSRVPSARLQIARKAWQAYVPRDPDPLLVAFKDFGLGSSSSSEEFPADGLVMMPDVPGIAFGRCWEAFKLKQEHTVDFVVDRDGMGLCVYDHKLRANRKVSRLAGPSVPGRIVECDISTDPPVLVQMRTDKTKANDVLTYERTVHNASEKIQEAEIFMLLDDRA